MRKPGRRGPKRNEQARLAILNATAGRVREHGYDRLTIEGVAGDAGVAKQTIYRWWPSRSALVADCLGEKLLLTELFVPEDSGDLRADMVQWLENIVRFLRSEGNTGLLRSLIIASAENPEVAQRLNDRLGMWDILGVRFQAAIDAGQLTGSIRGTELGEALLGALVVRDLRNGELTSAFAERLIDALLPAPVWR